MNKPEQLLCRLSRPCPTRHRQRWILCLRHARAYQRCLHHLHKNGIRPLKQIKHAHSIAFYGDGRRTKDFVLLRSHPEVIQLEKDLKIRAHAVTTDLTPAHSASPLIYPPAWSSLRISPAAENSSLPWGLNAIQAQKAWPVTKGSGIRIGIIDTGIGPHPQLKVSGGINTITPGGPILDDNGHGTHVAGIAAATLGRRMSGTAPRARLYAVKALDQNGVGYISDIIEGVEWCINNRIQIINMSLGTRGNSRLLQRSLQRAYAKGIVLVASAGNSGTALQGIDYPARYPQVMAIAASDIRSRIADFSSRGAGIDLTAPGVNIYSTLPHGRYGYESGTSMSSPFVSGTAALLLAQKRSRTPAAVRRLLTSTTRKLKGYSQIAQGKGLIQADRAVMKNAR
ncbi:S8 family peptidase [Paenibacillus sp. JX-17]|uniref:S8 family peptidase n=1 Tax=Paenibacillus lacisoli TaxID=3064525 RepID=A0ABT9C791_9BACL|nr:S8 family peptidase [Paenibacillus sp. JX-17]MDO7905134.1 S8 family peptidase [Paenibacillus sp. JX-17]